MAEETYKNFKGPTKKVVVLWWIYLLIGFVASVIVASMGYIFYVGNHMTVVHTPLTCAAMEIKIEVTTAHLWFEEIISGDRDESIDAAWGHLDEADWYAQAMLEGGENPHWKYYQEDDATVRREIESIQAKLAEFRAITQERFSAPAASPAGSEIDRRYDAVFAELMNGADQVEAEVKQMIGRELRNFRIVQTVLIFICVALTVLVGIVIGRFMHRQIRDELKLRAANQQLDASNQQLRASEQQLKAANQQLLSSEQQLKAANQQLRADEQQLKASNQQLLSSEQQLKAANQQLIANEQQLRASNQQLLSSEQQLKAANQQLIASQEEIQSLANFPSENSNPVLRVAKDGIVLYSNEAGTPLLTAWDTQMGRRLPDKWRKFAADVFGSGSSKETECDYDDHVLSLTFTPVVDLSYVNVYGLDITKRKRAEQQLKTSLEEKEVLLREIHHRVKNNLQIIVSLLSLQSEYVKDKQAVELFRQSQFRVKSMALLHERLYETKDLAHINFSDYIRDLTNELLCSYGPDAGNIKLKINVKNVFPSVDVAVPCALIINELVSNCLKHAFPKGRAGEIRIEFNLDKQDSYTLLISDDGMGFAKDVDFPDGRTLGLQLVSTLAEQLQASVVLDKSAGTSFKISFSKPQ